GNATVWRASDTERGTIKNRHIMTNAPHLLIEGMILGGLVAGARQGIIYIRHEYPTQEHILQHEIDRCYRDGILGASVMGSGLSFDLQIFVSPGLYICGEERALLDAIAREGVCAARGDESQGGEAAQQAALSRAARRRAVGQAHGDQQRRDVLL